MARKLQHVSVNLKDKEMIKSIFILMQLKNIVSPGTSQWGQGVTEWVRGSTNIERLCDEKKWRIWCSDQRALNMWTVPQPSIPPILPKAPSWGSALEWGGPGESSVVTDWRCITVSHKEPWALACTVPGLRLATTRSLTPLLNSRGLLLPRKPSSVHSSSFSFFLSLNKL